VRVAGKLACDATTQREGVGDGKPCKRRVVVEQRREVGDAAWTMHYCERHRGRKPDAPVRLLGVREIPLGLVP